MTKMNADKSIEVIKTDKAGPPVGPYSQGIKAGGFVFVAGEKGMDPVTQKMVPGGIEPETRRTLENIKAILEEAGSGTQSMTMIMNEFTEKFRNSVLIGRFATIRVNERIRTGPSDSLTFCIILELQ